ncbi:MAG: CIA30 family protein [Arenibacterium sp.]
MTMLSKVLALGFSLLLGALPVAADDMVIDDFNNSPDARWRFFADTVMGGVSTGQVSFVSAETSAYARMTGDVSTANNGGVIQMRIELPDAAPEGADGVRLIVRGNEQRYFVHLRTGGTVLPWQYYQAGFDVARDWTEIRLPFTAFEPSGSLLRKTPRSRGLKSLGIVAYGRDHIAEIEVLEVGFY